MAMRAELSGMSAWRQGSGAPPVQEAQARLGRCISEPQPQGARRVLEVLAQNRPRLSLDVLSVASYQRRPHHGRLLLPRLPCDGVGDRDEHQLVAHLLDHDGARAAWPELEADLLLREDHIVLPLPRVRWRRFHDKHRPRRLAARRVRLSADANAAAGVGGGGALEQRAAARLLLLLLPKHRRRCFERRRRVQHARAGATSARIAFRVAVRADSLRRGGGRRPRWQVARRAI
mmetsp:Transcript_105201/g.303442  ORF Transcript_105201/g.303442 Transcript_105201/m.303442 type:complete len:232 (-) Transcript_105201:623-1318(-)